MIDYPISRYHTDKCHEILTRASNVARFTKDEFQLIYGALNWIEDPYDEFVFSFNMEYAIKDESTTIRFEICDEYFIMSDMKYLFEEVSGGDSWYSMVYKTSKNDSESRGEPYDWLNTANELFDIYEKDDTSVRITVNNKL